MAKSDGKDRSKRKNGRVTGKKRDDGSADIKRAEERLAKALAAVDDARSKVARRERDLAALMERHGRTPALDASPDAAIPLEAPSQSVSGNGTAHADADSTGVQPDEEHVGHPVGADSPEQHG
jgi:hypothetical protein